ncbi:MAG: hypothetical protein IKK64_02225, partial [Bacteroidales bacterium]|nr:hypothetical protein [Bacteroidales bacterium]
KVLPSGTGNVTIDGSTTTPKYVVPGTNVTYVATAKSGYKFKGWNMEGIEISTSNTLILPINSNTEITAVFQNIPNYSVTVVSSGNGTVSSSSSSVQEGGSVTLTATPNSGYVFKNWTLNGNVVSTQNPYTAIVTANSVYVANFIDKYNGHEYVDLGLSVKWATCNVGATTPEEYGNYYAWGETTPKTTSYDWITYKWCNGDKYSMTKYCTSSNYGTVDNKTTLELTDDAAHVNWGGSWRMPTYEELEELMDTNNCTWNWTTQNGVRGYKVTSKKNGNSIFLPAAGYRSNSNLNSAGSYGYYWSSSLYTSSSSSSFAYYLDFISGNVDWDYFYRYYGRSVRAVCE